MNPTTDKIQLSQADYNNIADWAKSGYTVAPNSVASTVPLQQPQSAIPSTALEPVQNIKVPEIKPVDTGSQSIVASTQPSVDTALQNFNQAQTAVGTQAEDARSSLTKLAESIFGQKADAQANQAELEKQLGLDEQQKALNQINTEMANEQVGLRNELESIRNVPGQTLAQYNLSKSVINETYGKRLADLAIRQSAANNNITSIITQAERKTKLLTAPLDTKIQYLSTFAKDNVDYLDKKQSEKLAFIVDDLKTQKQDIQALENAKAQMITEIANNGGGANTALIAKIQGAKDLGEITSLGASSGYVGKLDRTLKQAQISKIYQDIEESKFKNNASANGLRQLSSEENARLNSTPEAKTINDGTKFYNALAAYRAEIERSGTGEWFGADAGAINSAYQTVVGSIKDYYQLGTLDNGVEKLVALGIPKPSVLGIKSNRIGGIDKQMDVLSTNIAQASNQLMNTGYANTVEAQGLIGKGTGIVKSRQDPLGVMINSEANTTSTDPLKLNQ